MARDLDKDMMLNPSDRGGRRSTRRGISLKALLNNYLLRHIQTFFYTLGQLSARPFSTFMTAAVIGIALSMPAGLNLLLNNAQEVLQGWSSATQISLFLTHKTSERQAKKVASILRKMPEIAAVEYISKESALEEFSKHSGFGEALDALEHNPLPAVLLITPEISQEQPDQIAALLDKLAKRSEVDIAQLDMEWVERLFALMAIGERGVLILSGLLAIAVLLVVGNTIRLAIQNRRDEIIIIKLIGATDSFIRRPFLYTGFWYGLLGGLIALMLVEISLTLIATPVRDVALLYRSTFELQGIDSQTLAALLGVGSFLGYFGSWIAVGRHLREIEPS
ncbi:MAG: permease-like cell division protein FtsX [Gammaproteobacteria bacterium]|nr:permease-like cell division protein FtsX [Gammaproteobacteria bacterium]